VSKALPKRCRTYRYRLHPTVRQTQALTRQLHHQCELYNAALEERKGGVELGETIGHLL
jgi:transposase